MFPKVPLFYFKVFEVYFHRVLHPGICPNFFYLFLYFTWIIHGSSLPDCHAPLATTMLFKIYVVGCEAHGMRLWFFNANAL